MTIGSELDKQIYPEGENTWGFKEGFLDVEDVRNSIKNIINGLINDWEFSKKAKVEPSIHPRRVMEMIKREVGMKLIDYTNSAESVIAEQDKKEDFVPEQQDIKKQMKYEIDKDYIADTEPSAEEAGFAVGKKGVKNGN